MPTVEEIAVAVSEYLLLLHNPDTLEGLEDGVVRAEVGNMVVTVKIEITPKDED